MTTFEKVIKYDRSAVDAYDGVLQGEYWNCGIATLQIIANGCGINISEADLLAKVNSTISAPGDKVGTNGTNHAGLLIPTANALMPGSGYREVWLPEEPVKQAQVDQFWQHFKRSIESGHGVVLNFQVPPGSVPVTSRGSVPPPYPRWTTTYHYTAGMGAAELGDGSRHGWVADPAGFGGITGYWCRIEELARLIVPHAYAYAAEAPIKIESPAPTPAPTPAEQPVNQPVVPTNEQIWNVLSRFGIEWDSIMFGHQDAIGTIVALAKSGDERAQMALSKLEQVNPVALQTFINTMKGTQNEAS